MAIESGFSSGNQLLRLGPQILQAGVGVRYWAESHFTLSIGLTLARVPAVEVVGAEKRGRIR